MISAVKTSMPALLKNLEIFIGEAYTGLQGMKYRVLSKGMKKPTPKPLSVMESRNPFEAYHNKKEGEQPPPSLGKSGHGPERKEHDDKAR